MPPSELRAASSARPHEAGLPMRIAVAMVWGSVTGCPVTNGAAPAGWKPNSCGGSGTTPGAGSPGGLEPKQVGRLGEHPVGGVLGVAEPVARYVAGVTHRHAMDVGRTLEEVADLERGGLLPLETERVDAVDEGDGKAFRKISRELERCVEVAFNLDHPRAVDERRRHLPHRDLALRD